MPDQKEYYMRRALALAARGAGHVDPNPMVGCVIVKDGRIIAEGWHEHIGGLHAERNAFAHCTEDAAGADLYVTLEPCCHWGRTPPCTDAILEHRIRRVFVGCLDPNPLVAGKGAQILRDAGIEVETGVCEAECREINEVFFHYITHRTPFVVLKYAMTLDGKIAAHTGDSRWVTGEAARRRVHETRNRLSGIMVGVGTVLADDPLLTCRIPEGKNPTRIIADTHLQIPLDAQIVKTAREVPTILAVGMRDTSAPDSQAETDSKAAALQEAGCQILFVPTGEDGHLHLPSLMEKLGSMGIDSILLEGGSRLNWSALSAGQVHLLQAYLAPKLLGGDTARGPIGGIGYPNPEDCVRLSAPTIRRFGADILLESEVISPCLPES